MLLTREAPKHSLLMLFVALMVSAAALIAAVGIPARYAELVAIAALDGHTLALGLTPQGYALIFMALDLLSLFIWSSIAAIIFWQKRDDSTAVFFALTIFSVGVTESTILSPTQMRLVDGVYIAPHVLTPLSEAFQAFSGAALFVSLYLMPDGRFEPRWTRYPVLLWIVLDILWFLFPHLPFNYNYGDTFDKTFELSLLFSYGFIALGFVAQRQRLRRTQDPAVRQQIKWISMGFVVAYIAGSIRHAPLASIDFGGTGALLFMMIVVIIASVWPACIAIAILRYRLWDMGLLINRTLVYTIVITILAAMHILLVSLFTTLTHADLQAGGNLLASLVATGVITVVFQPLRTRIQRQINRLTFGYRDDPYLVMKRLSRSFQTVKAADRLLDEIVSTLIQALNLTYAALYQHSKIGEELVAQYGSPPARATNITPLGLPLSYQGKTIGRLLVFPNSANAQFTPEELDLLHNIAAQAGLALHNVHLAGELRAAINQAFEARDDERQRLSRDLHDDLGARLGAFVLAVDTVHNYLRYAPDKVDEKLIDLKQQIKQALEDMRSLTKELRRSDIEQHGLIGALNVRLAPYGQKNGLAVDLHSPPTLPPLSYDLEVTIYRMALEGINNVIRHAQATRCVVTLSLDAERLLLEIADNGKGITVGAKLGLGLPSMQQRAQGFGGECRWLPRVGGGTVMQAWFPLEVVRA